MSDPIAVGYLRWIILAPLIGAAINGLLGARIQKAAGKTPIVDAVSKMVAKRINCLPVVEDDGTVCGIVTSTDLLKSYQQLLELVRKQAG